MTTDSASDFLILGVTEAGRPFRPSDWADRLCGVMSPYRPPGAGGPQAHLGYSPYVMPGVHEGQRCVRVDGRLHRLEPLAYKFLVGFARDNGLQVRPVPEALGPPTGEKLEKG